jgi:RNA recognition motif-containing protein
MAIKNIMIRNINLQYTAEYIAYVLLSREIAQVSSITLIPEIENEMIFNIAYIDIESYCDTEAAYEFIENIKYGFFILHNDLEEYPWIAQQNNHNEGGLSVGTYTMNFNYHENQDLSESPRSIEYPNFEEFKNEIYIEYSINNSDNVTLRPYQYHYKDFQESQDLSELHKPIEYPSFEEFKNEFNMQYAINNSNNITLRPYQYDYKQLQESQVFPREMIWRSELIRSVSDLSV